jgi:hypothetical protein
MENRNSSFEKISFVGINTKKRRTIFLLFKMKQTKLTSNVNPKNCFVSPEYDVKNKKKTNTAEKIIGEDCLFIFSKVFERHPCKGGILT